MISDNKKIEILVPLHITGFFAPFFTKDPLFCGSIGAGLILEPKIKCCLEVSQETEIFFNGEKIKIEPVKEVLKAFENPKVKIQIFSPVCMGVGYGTSGAVALGVALGLCKLFKKPKKEGAKIAHLSEVKCLTGLGDVLAIFCGKELAVRTTPGAPGIGKVRSFFQKKDIKILTCDLKRENTKKMLKKITPKIAFLGEKLTKDFLKNPTLENFFQFSQIFAKEIGWQKKELFKKLEKIEKFCIGFSIKKGVLFLGVKKDNLKKVSLFLKNEISKNFHVFKLSRLKNV